jgi:drug/metabolite transporter (DMT)-like permease
LPCSPGLAGLPDRVAERWVKRAELILFAMNIVYATSYVATRATLGSVPPGTLAFTRLVIAWAALAPFARPRAAEPPISRSDRRTIAWMGLLGFAGAYAFSHWGIARSTASNAALLIVVEPLTLMLASPFYLGERLSPREAVGAALAVVGTALVVVNGIPGVTEKLVPHWQGDLLLVLAGVAYAAYSLLGRRVLARHAPLGVTTRSLAWGAGGILPVVAAEWASGARPAWAAPAVAGTLYLALVISALGYVAWNWALARVPAPRAALFLNVQPIAGALLGAVLLDEPLNGFTIFGGVAIVAGLAVAFGRASR